MRAAHSSCVGLGEQRTNAPRGDWACPACIDHALKQIAANGEDDDEEEDAIESEEDSLSLEEIQDINTTCVTLRGELDRLGLLTRGRKRDLVQRLLDYHSHT